MQSDDIYDKSEISFKQDSKYDGFIAVNAKGHYTTLGTNQEKTVPLESPAMRVNFDYDFSMASHEITQQEYYELIDGEPCEGCGNFPISDVTYGDIIYFANAKSKKEGLDTVYTYDEIVYDAAHHINALENLAFHPEVRGFRLPTEAEWVLVASKFWDTKKSWNNSNSDYKAHEVCTISDKNDKFCDLIGNVAEWVNDWSGKYLDTTLTDYVGPPNGGSTEERIIKGGYFKKAPSSIKLYSKGDTYTITSQSKAEYVGARLAIGKIPNPVWLDGNRSEVPSTFKPLLSLNSIKKMFGTIQVKLAFIDGMTDHLVFTNFNDGIFYFAEFTDVSNVYHPDISPDGNWVAFSTGKEGSNSKSSVFVRRLNLDGSDLMKLDVESAAIPRFDINPEGDTVIVYVTGSGDNTDKSTFLQSSTWEVPFSNGTFGTPKKLFDGAYHGGISPNRRLAVSGSKVLRARIADKSSDNILDDKALDTTWYNDEQACNVSLSQDGTNRTAFLDFQSASGTSYVGKDYSTHERLFITDSTGKLIQSIGAPRGYTFDFTEWIGKTNLIVSSLTDDEYMVRSKLAVINVKDSSITEIVDGDNMLYPCIWVNPLELTEEEKDLNLDSLGAYMTASSDITTRIMKVKMDYFWKHRESIEVAIIGSSRSFSGLDPTEVKSYFTMNLAYAAQDLASTDYFVQNYFLHLMPKLKAIIITLDYDRWYVTDKNWKDWFGNVPGYKYDEHHSFWKDGVPDRMYELTQNALTLNESEYNLYGYHNGLYHSTTEGVSGTIPSIDNDLHWLDSQKKAYEFNLKKVRNILDSAKAAGVLVVGAIFPQSPYYAQTHSAWGRYGLTLKDAEKIESAVNELTKEYDNFVILDEYKNGQNDFVSEDFANDDHLGLKGAVKVAKHIDSLLVANKDKLPEN